MATVHLDGMLRQFVSTRSVELDADDVSGLIDRIEETYPRLRYRLRDEAGVLRRYVRIFVNGQDVSHVPGLTTPLRAGDKVDILHSIQGG
ncbi:MAG: MoaD family protein [Thermoplasmata archaeon]